MDILARYHLYLYALGYKVNAVHDEHNTVNDYVNAVKYVARLEQLTIEQLVGDIQRIFSEYDNGGTKHTNLPQNDQNRTFNGFKHFKEFIELCKTDSL